MKVRDTGEISYDDLDAETKADVAYAIGFKTGEVRKENAEDWLTDVTIGLENGPCLLPLVAVDPATLLKASPGRPISRVAARKYASQMVAGAGFPPIVIDSDKRKDILIEGGHRALAATMAKIPEIPAIDIAGARIVFVGKGVERFSIYDFKRRRITK
jgi:hypothetical protein